jgi:outer membrane protein assembly factor BamE (lipoprotein component of BamABCDE complex)
MKFLKKYRPQAIGLRALVSSIIAGAVLAVLAGCSYSGGVQIKDEQLSGIEVGKTTYQEVISKFGMPTQRTVDISGNKQIYYAYSQVQTRPETFIPLVGVFVGGANMQNGLVAFYFDKNDLLTNLQTSEGAMGAGAGTQSRPSGSQ